MGADDAYGPSGQINPSRMIDLFTDVASELMIRLDGDEGVLRNLQQVEVLNPVYVGDFIEATGAITKIGNTTRQIAFEARKVATYARSPDLALSAADALPSPPLVCRAVGTCVVLRAQQRRPRLVLPPLPPAGGTDATRLPAGHVVVTPPPHVVITPPRQTPPEVMLAASILGGGVTREHSPHVPVSPAEVAAEAKRCRSAGASVVYLGIDDGELSAQGLAARARALVAAIRQETDVVVAVSSVVPGPLDVARRTALADCGADMVALAAGSYNFGDAVVQTPRTAVREIAAALRDRQAPTIVEVFELGHIDEAIALSRENLLVAPHRFQVVLGVPGALGAHEELIRFVANRMPRGAVWFTAGVGRHQRRVAELSLRLGGHVRLGLADNIYVRKGVLAEGSAPFIERCAAFARGIGRDPVEPARARFLLGLGAQDAATSSDGSDAIPEVASAPPAAEPAAEPFDSQVLASEASIDAAGADAPEAASAERKS
jgi:3-keto-5-aminohexanoate cleavage enzyme